jgi:FixJ family two-component response regulator
MAPSRPRKHKASGASVSKARLIAVVDDDDSIRRALTRLLRDYHFEVLAFSSGQEFLNSLRKQRPDCVILDFQMPELTGGDVQCLLSLAGIQLPIIIMTAYDHPAMREECLRMGAVACIAKGDLPDRLIDAIGSAMALRVSSRN